MTKVKANDAWEVRPPDRKVQDAPVAKAQECVCDEYEALLDELEGFTRKAPVDAYEAKGAPSVKEEPRRENSIFSAAPKKLYKKQNDPTEMIKYINHGPIARRMLKDFERMMHDPELRAIIMEAMKK